MIESSEIQINLYERKTNKDVDDIAKFWPVPENRFHEQSDDLKITNFYPISKNKIIISQFPEWIKDQSLDKAEKLTNKEIAQELSLPPVKIHCSVLAEEAIKAAIEDYRKKKSA